MIQLKYVLAQLNHIVVLLKVTGLPDSLHIHVTPSQVPFCISITVNVSSINDKTAGQQAAMVLNLHCFCLDMCLCLILHSPTFGNCSPIPPVLLFEMPIGWPAAI